MEDVRRLAEEEFARITVEEWEKVCAHVEQVEEEYLSRKFTLDDVAKLINPYLRGRGTDQSIPVTNEILESEKEPFDSDGSNRDPNFIPSELNNEEDILENNSNAHKVNKDQNVEADQKAMNKKKTKLKRRLRNKDQWKVTKKMKLTVSGKQYVSKTGKMIDAKTVKPGCVYRPEDGIDDFKNFTGLYSVSSAPFTNKKQNVDKEPFHISAAEWLNVRRDDPAILFYKNNLTQENFKSMNPIQTFKLSAATGALNIGKRQIMLTVNGSAKSSSHAELT
ncbi:hypothetical protein ILUMI_04944, partial [Ignelater luminosus]